MADPCLTTDELYDITGYRQAKRQLEVLVKQGYPAFMRPNNTVSLGVVQYENGPPTQESKLHAPSPRPLRGRANGKATKATRRAPDQRQTQAR